MRQLPRLTCLSVCAAFAFAAACGGSQKPTGTEGPAAGGGEPTPAGAADQAFSYEAVPVVGTMVSPGVTPPMPNMPRPKNMKRAAKKAARAAKRGRGEAVYEFVAAKWEQATEAEKAKQAAKAKEIRGNAIALLETLRKKQGKKASAMTLQMLGIARLAQGDAAGAAKAFKAGVDSAKKGEAGALKTLLAYAYLKEHRTAEAAKLVAGTEVTDETEPFAAYVAGWVAFRQGDYAKAQAGLVRNIKGWDSAAALPDLLITFAYGGTPVADADAILTEFAGGSLERRYNWMFYLSQQYKVAGQYALASDTLDYLLTTVAANKAPKKDVVKFRFFQADYQFRLGNPEKAAEFAIQAQKAAAACEQCDAQTKEAVAKRVAELAKVFHNVYATSLDLPYYEPAHKLYSFYVNDVPARDDTQTISGYLKNLEETKANASPANGKHDKDVMRNRVVARIEVLQACYSAALGNEPTLEGTVTLTVDVSETGEVAGATTDPPPGQEGLAAVAACVEGKVRGWSFPARTVPGKTSLSVPLALSLTAPAPAAAPAK